MQFGKNDYFLHGYSSIYHEILFSSRTHKRTLLGRASVSTNNVEVLKCVITDRSNESMNGKQSFCSESFPRPQSLILGRTAKSTSTLSCSSIRLSNGKISYDSLICTYRGIPLNRVRMQREWVIVTIIEETHNNVLVPSLNHKENNRIMLMLWYRLK